MQSNAAKQVAERREFLTFLLGSEEYAIEILKVQEIRGYESVTPLANAPRFIKGVVNLRGNIVPIIDLRIKFNLENAEYGERTVVVILNVARRIIGVVVDAVSDVIALDPDDIKPAPEFGTLFDTRHLMGLGTIDERMLILVDIERLMTSDEMGLVDKTISP